MSFSVTVAPSGRQFTVDPNETVLAAGLRQAVGLPYGCKDGACGTCKCLKISGQVHHGPHQTKALSTDEESRGMVLLCCATAQSDLVLESRLVVSVGQFVAKKMPVRVLELEQKSADVMRLRLQLPANDRFQYHAGQYLDILLRDGSRRSYSMANAPHLVGTDVQSVELHIRHTPGGKFTDHVFGAMKEKEILRAEGPMGSFFLREDSDKPIVMLASGTGMAPIKALLEHMRFKGLTRPTTLYWGGRRPGDLYIDDWVRAELAAQPHVRYVPVLSEALPEDHWSGRTGFVHLAVLADFPNLAGHQVYACGAPVVIDAARADFTQRAGLPIDEFYADSFITAADKQV